MCTNTTRTDMSDTFELSDGFFPQTPFAIFLSIDLLPLDPAWIRSACGHLRAVTVNQDPTQTSEETHTSLLGQM